MISLIRKIDRLFGGKIRVLYGYIIKDLQNTFRFKLTFINFVFAPFLTMLSFLMVYRSFFKNAGSSDVGFINEGNYILYLLTGFLAYSCFHVTWGKTGLSGEKQMLTLDGMLLGPRSRLYIMFGKGFNALIEILIISLLFIILLFFIKPEINIADLFFGVLGLLLIFIIFTSFDFILSAIGLCEEGFHGLLMNYLPRAFLIIGAVYFPIDAIPRMFHFLVRINPVYIGVNLFRNAFMEADLTYGVFGSLIYLAVLALFMPFVASKVFDFILRKWGIRGY